MNPWSAVLNVLGWFVLVVVYVVALTVVAALVIGWVIFITRSIRKRK